MTMTTTETVKDGTLVAALASSPAWAPALGDVNDLLTTITLVLGILIALGRIWLFFRDRSGQREDH